jgi:hypothetical protein
MNRIGACTADRFDIAPDALDRVACADQQRCGHEGKYSYFTHFETPLKSSAKVLQDTTFTITEPGRGCSVVCRARHQCRKLQLGRRKLFLFADLRRRI